MCVVSVSQWGSTLRDPIDCSPPGSSVHGILQARILDWVVSPFSGGSSQPRDPTQVSHMQADSFPSQPPVKLSRVGLLATPWTIQWNSPGQNSGVGCHSLSPGDLPKPGLLHFRQILFHLNQPVQVTQSCPTLRPRGLYSP